MFWRFGFHACSAIDTLLDKPDVTLEEILGEDDLLQECKAHNTKLIEYLRDPNILSKLLNYIIADEQVDDKAKFKYSYVSCEVLSCEIWSICETVVQSRELLTNFWSFIDRPSPLNPLQASYFTKVNEQFLEKKTNEMIPFIQSIPNIVPKLLRHIETSAIMDLLLKIISMEKSEPGSGIVEWLHDEGLVQALLVRMNPNIQGTVADVLKAIIAISANSSDAGVIGPNALSRELVSEATISRILDYMLDPNAPYSTASLTNGVSLIIELIRKNNSDYDIEPVLSLTLESHPPTSRDPIYLGTMLRLFASRINDFQKLLAKPRSVSASIATTFGHIEPLGFERFRICELYAELLHCSNMVLLNDPRGEEIVKERDIERERLRKECRRNPTKIDTWDDTNLGNGRQWDPDTSSSNRNDDGHMNDGTNIGMSNGDPRQKYMSKDNNPESRSVAILNEDEARSNIEVDIVISQEQGDEQRNDRTHDQQPKEHDPKLSENLAVSTLHSMSEAADTVSKKVKTISAEGVSEKQPVPSHFGPSEVRPVVGDYLKMQFVEAKILPSMVDLFFSHPWNNFLHNVVYDILTQVLNGPMDKGFNRQLAVDLFTTGQLTEKILQGQKASDEAQAMEKGVRLGYMGHLTLIAEEVLKLAERIPLDLLDVAVVRKLTSPEWNDYVDVTLTATRTRDNAILGGVRPQPSGLTTGLNSTILRTTSELSSADDGAILSAFVNRGIRYENGNVIHGDEDFEADQEDRETTEEPFVRYISQTLTNDHPDKSGSSDEDDDDEVVEWMGGSDEFGARNHGSDEIEEDEEDVRNFGGRGLFHDGWEGDFHDDEDEFGFRPAGAGFTAEEHDVNSSDDEIVDEDRAEDLEQEPRLGSSSIGLADSMDSLGLGNKESPDVQSPPGTKPTNSRTFVTFDEKTSTRSKQAMIMSNYRNNESWDDLIKSEESTMLGTGRTHVGQDTGPDDVD